MSTVFLLLCLVAAAEADQLRFSSARQWSDWQLPLGAVEVAPTGSIQPLRVYKKYRRHTRCPPARRRHPPGRLQS